MRRNLISVMVGMAAVVWAGLAAPANAGDITPPAGPIGSTMKTLDQVEPRIAVSTNNTPGTATALLRITQPGSYYLAGNITGVSTKSGIEIAASDVTLDLNGFRMVGVAGSLAGISVTSGQSNVAIRNGTLRSWGGGGIAAGSCAGCIVEEVRSIGNTGHGMQLGPDSMVRRCYCVGNSGTGILASSPSEVNDCLVRTSGSSGLSVGDHSIVSGTVAQGNTSTGVLVGAGALVSGDVIAQNGLGVSASSGLNAVNCVARNNSSHGFFCFGASYSNCLTTVNGGDGINTDAALVNGCRATSNTGEGVHSGNNSLVLHSVTISNGSFGVHGSNGFILQNVCSQDCTTATELREIKCDNNGRIEGNHLFSTNSSLWGTGGSSGVLMMLNSINGGFVPTFGGTHGPVIDSSNITSDSNFGNIDLP